MAKNKVGLSVIERIARRVSIHTEHVLCDWCNDGHGPQMDKILRSERRLVAFIEKEMSAPKWFVQQNGGS